LAFPSLLKGRITIGVTDIVVPEEEKAILAEGGQAGGED
jgi:hypothetical protein